MRLLLPLLFSLGIAASIQTASVGPAQAALSTPPATLATTDSNEPYVKTTCNRAFHSNTVTGRVTSSQAIQIPQFDCEKFGGRTGISFNMDPHGRGVGPCKNPVRSIPSLPWGRYCPNTPNTPWLTMTVQLANRADASKMPPGKLVTLKGDFFVLTENNVNYLFVQNAKVLYADPFGR